LILPLVIRIRLGLREDWDLAMRLKKAYNVQPLFVNAWCFRHFAHFVDKWRAQALWLGKTLVRFLRIWPMVRLRVLIQRLDGPVSLLFAALFLSRVLAAYLVSAERRRFPIGYSLLRESYWALTFLTAFIAGVLAEVRKLLSIHPSLAPENSLHARALLCPRWNKKPRVFSKKPSQR
jgi:hypothetical protein